MIFSTLTKEANQHFQRLRV